MLGMYRIRHLSPVWSRKRPEFDVELSGGTLASGKESAIWQGLAPPGVIFRPLQQTLSWFTGSAGAIVASERRPLPWMINSGRTLHRFATVSSHQ